MKDRSKKLLVINTGKKGDQEGVYSASAKPSVAGGAGMALSGNLSDYLLKSIWDRVWEIKTDSQGNEYIFGKLPVVTQYGITMYADGGELNLPSIYAGIPFDNKTIWFNPDTGKVEVIGGTGGGVADSVHWNNIEGKPLFSAVATSGKYADLSGLPDLNVYATTEYLTAELKKYVTLNTEQPIDAHKNFLNGLSIGGLPITKSQDDVLYIDGNLAVRGGITMYATDAIDVPSIIDALPIASASVKGIAAFNSNDFSVVDGYVSFIGKGGVDESVLADYAKKTDLSAYLPLSGGQMTGDIGYSIGKGSYDIGIPSSGTIEAGLIFEAKDFKNLKSFIGTYHDSSDWMNIISVRHRNGYNDGGGYGMYIVSNLTSRSADLVWNRQFNPTEWQGDRVILDSVNWSQYVTAADGGHYLSLSGGIINGNNNGWVLEVQSTKAKTYLSHGGGYGLAVESTSTDDSTYMMYCGNGLGKTVFKVSNLGNTMVGGALYVSPESSYGLVEVGLKSGKYAYLDNSTPTGRGVSIVAMNADTCVGGLGVQGNGQPCYIDAAYTSSPLLYGKCDVNINTSDWGISFSANNAAKCWLMNGGGYGMYIGVNNSDGNKYLLSLNSGQSILGSGGNIAMSVYNNGNMLVGGGITMYSDIRKKTKLQDVELTLQQIADAPLIEHYYNSDTNKTTHVGSIAQYWAGINDWFCKLDSEGFYTMEIQNAALASAISIARELVKYESKTDRKIRLLKQRVKELEDKIEKLENN